MIEFRCWYCNRRYSMAKRRIGERITCTCQYPLRVPQRSGGKCRIKTLGDRLVEAVVYGGGGGLLGFGLAWLLLAFGGAYLLVRLYRFLPVPRGWRVEGLVALIPAVLAMFTLIGFLIGLFGGERGINWIGRIIRRAEDR